MIVRENIEFQRGEDPKKMMGLGKEPYKKYAVSNLILVLNFNDQVFNNMQRVFKNTWDNIYFLGDDWLLRDNETFKNTIYSLIKHGDLIKEHTHKRHYTGGKVSYRLYQTPSGKLLVLNDSFEGYFGDLSVAASLRVDQLKELNERIAERLRESVEFRRGKDPRQSMNIGLISKIKNAVPKIMELDNKALITDSFPPNIHFIRVTFDRFEIHFFSNDFYDEEGNPIDKGDYAQELVNGAGIKDCFYPKLEVNGWTADFYIKDQFKRYFSPGEYESGR